MPVEIVDCEVCETGSPPSFSSWVVHSYFYGGVIMFKKSERKENIDDGIICNLDNVPVISTLDGRFLIKFNFDQQCMLKYCLDKDYSVRGFAYPSYSSVYMEEIVRYLDSREHFDNHFDDLDIWKIVHTNFAVEKLRAALKLLDYGFNICMLENAAAVPISTMELLYEALSLNINVVSLIRNGILPQETYISLQHNVEKKKKKAAIVTKINRWT